jgi:hypothetical protein
MGTTRSTALAAAAYAAAVLVFLTVYGPAAGHGFISDDFGWLLHNRIRIVDDIQRIALADNGFYRPAVAFSFALNELAFGLNPRAFGLTNLALAMLCGAAVYLLCRAVAVPRGAAAFGAALWLFNLQGVNMAILWISGRTALLATAAAVASTAALLRGHRIAAAALLAAAVLSREDAALLPIVSTVWLVVLRPDLVASPRVRWKPAAVWLAASSAIVVAYLALRSTTGAMTPATAPDYYRFTTSLQVVIRNAAEYADRTMTFSVAALLLLALLLRPGWPLLDAGVRRIMLCGLVWLGAFLAPALLLPVRSSLYACLPSAGVCAAASAVAARWWTLASPARRRHALAAAVLVPLLMWPVYHARTLRWVAMAEFSTKALDELEIALLEFPDDTEILIADDRHARANMASVFSTLLRDAFLVTTGRFMTFYVDPPIPNAGGNGGGSAGCGGCEDLRFVVKDGRLVRDGF